MSKDKPTGAVENGRSRWRLREEVHLEETMTCAEGRVVWSMLERVRVHSKALDQGWNPGQQMGRLSSCE